MASAEIEALERDSYTTSSCDAQASESKHDDTTMASAETEAFEECNPYVMGAIGPVDGQAIGIVHDGITMESMKTEEALDLDLYARVSVDTVEMQAGGGENDSSIVGFGETEALECSLYATASVNTVDLQAGVSTYDGREALECDSVTIASDDTNDVRSGSEHEGTVAEREALECDPYATASVDTAYVQSGGSVTIMALAETKASDCNAYATTAVDIRVSVEEGTVTSPGAQNVQQEATNLVSGDDEVSVTELGSNTHLATAVTPSVSMVSIQEGPISSACGADKTEDKFEEVIVYHLEESQGEHAFDIGDFDIGAHEVPMAETFFSKHCMFPALDADRAEAWEAAGDDVIMKDNSLEHDGDQQENIDKKFISTETNSNVVVNHEMVVMEEQGAHSTQLHPSSETVPMDAVHGVEESSGLQASHKQGPLILDGFQCGETNIGNAQGSASGVVTGEKLLYNDPEDVGAQDVNSQCDAADDIFAGFPGENMEIVHAAGTYETRSSEDRFDTNNGVLGFENEAVQSYKFDQDLPGSSSTVAVDNTNTDTVSNDKELQRRLQTTVVGSRMEVYKSQEEGAMQAEIQGMVGKDALLNEKDRNDFSGAACTNSQSLNLAGNTEPISVPVNGEQEENASVIASGEIPIEAVSQSLAQEKAGTFSQNVTHDKVEVAQMVSDMEVYMLNREQGEKQGDDLPLMDGKSVDAFDDTVLDGRQSDGEMVLEDRDAVSEDKGAGPEQENEAINGQQEELCLGQLVDTCPPQDGEMVLEGRDVVSEDKVAGPEHENEAINGQQEELCLRQPVDTCPLRAEIAIQAVRHDLSMNLTISSSEPGDDVSSCSDSPRRNKISEGLNDDKEPTLWGLKPCEENREKKHCGSSEDAGAFSEKQVEKHIGDHKSPKAKGLEKLDSSIIEAKQSGGERSGMETNDDSSSSEHEEELPERKHIGDHKSSRAEGLKELESSIIKAKQSGGERSGTETNDDSPSSEHEEELPDRKLQTPLKEGHAFGIGDLVWAKVRSHPWWPAQIFDPADASKSARKAKKSGRVLVAFFGDCTFAWLQQSQMIAFRPNFKEKVKQTTMRIFCMAVEEALEEFCRRSELGLSCAHFKGSLHSTSSFPDANAGIREGVRVKRHKDNGASVQMFRPDKTLEFVKGVACSPLGAWSSSLQLSELRGHVYGLRTCMVASGSLETGPLIVPSQGSKLKRSFSSLKTEVAGGNGKEANRLSSGKDKRASEDKVPSQISKRLKTAIAGDADQTVGRGSDIESKSVVRKSLDASDGNRDRLSIKFKVSKKTEGDRLSNFERLSDTAAGQDAGSDRSSDDGGETLLAFAGKSIKGLNRSSLKVDTDSRSIKKKVRRQSVGESQNWGNRSVRVCLASGALDGEAAASKRTETHTDDAFTVSSSLSEERVSNAGVSKGKGKKKLANVASSSVSPIDAENVRQGTRQTKHSKSLKAGSKDEVKKAKLSETLEKIELKKDVVGNDNDASKKDAVRKLSKMGDSIRKVAGELTGAPVAKSVDDSLTKSTGPGAKKKMKDLALELQASPTPKKAASKESTEDVSLLQLRQDLELLANKAGSSGGMGKAVKHSKKADQMDTVGMKSSPHWQNHRSQRSCVQELALAARKRKSEIAHDEVLAKLPKTSSPGGSDRYHTSKAYISSAENPVERRSFDKSLLHYSRRPAPPASTGKSSSQRYDEKLSSHMPLGLFMRFPEDFPLPSESQLKATFIPFGPLQMSATRLYKDTASAQVVFKHGRDAESALKHAKKNALFGQVAVTYRLRYLSHSSRVETKMDAPSPNKANSSSTAPGKKSFLSKEKVGGPSASSKTRAGDNTSLSFRAQDATHSESEPTGDIQDQMMTLLRQVSVIVNTSP